METNNYMISEIYSHVR